MPDSLKDVLDTTVKMVNFFKARPLNSCVFSALCNDMGSDHVTLLQHFLQHTMMAKTTFESVLTLVLEGVRSWRLNIRRGTGL
jgi:hypothetical protein